MLPRQTTNSLCGSLLAVFTLSCASTPPPPPPEPVKKELVANALSRATFNQRAVEAFAPVFWREDTGNDGVLTPDELTPLVGISEGQSTTKWVGEDGKFTPEFEALYARLVNPPEIPASLDAAEKRRRAKVKEELAQGRPTLVETDMRSSTEEEKSVLGHLLRAAEGIERLYAQQSGVAGMEARIPDDDRASHAVFHRNQGPHCVAPKTERDPDCSALPARPKKIVGLYPSDLQADPKFCDALAKEQNASDLMGHFNVVLKAHPSGYQAVPYSTVYRAEMQGVAEALQDAAAAIEAPNEASFKLYLQSAARAFQTNDWESADEAWLSMRGNSSWYLRVAPDEVYHDPCNWKAGFALTLARINQASLAWQEKLEPVKGEMEAALAKLAGPPYRARKVDFKLPEFIDIVLNAGDSRAPLGATVGQSLPNWGRVAERGGRTVVMSNLYTDADSQKVLTEQMASLFCADTMKHASAAPEASLVGTLLHEAAHNLGPSHEYKVKGKVDDVIFGGPLASTLEELKAQTAALYFTEWLVDKKLLTPEEAVRSHVRNVAWAFGHIAQGMYTGDGRPKSYSQLAAIQLGELQKAGVVVWKAEQPAANGKDKGCFEVNLEKWRPAVEALTRTVVGAKGRGDKKTVEALKAEHVDAEAGAGLKKTITERWLRAPKASFYYSVRK